MIGMHRMSIVDAVARKPSLEIAPITLPQRTQQITKITTKRVSISKKEHSSPVTKAIPISFTFEHDL